MSNPYTGMVASALRKTQLILQAQEVESVDGNRLLQSAQLEGALLQLWRAHRAFLAEQGHQLQLGFRPGGEPDTARKLQELVLARGKFSAEVTELVSLEENPDSWFSAMARCWAALWRPTSGGDQTSATGGGVQALIPLRQMDSIPAAGLDLENLRHWLSQLDQLILRQRDQGREW
ncbi:DUF6586 family protein [Microbulbifer pacificus]|uniref:DUF6586 family protein n=1 Tax=Microbulbifer pacificus TaxID=407164 RepID=UPI000CF4FB1A|nr:DUF6586 family protein [Microbulbifer pacificus]